MAYNIDKLIVGMHVLWGQVMYLVDVCVLCAGRSGTSAVCGKGGPRCYRSANAMRSGCWRCDMPMAEDVAPADVF